MGPGPGKRVAALILILLLVAGFSPEADARFELHPRLRVEQEYNDNVFLRESNKFADWITGVYPGFDLAATSPTAGIELDYELGYRYYWDLNTDFTEHRAGLRGYKSFTPHLSVEATDTFYRFEELLEPGLGTLAPRTALTPYIRNMADSKLTYKYGPESDVSLVYSNVLLRNDDPAIQDGTGNRGGIELRHAIDQHNLLELGYSFERGDFEPVPGSRFFVIPDFNANRANAGYTYEATRRLHLLGVANFESINFLGPGVSDYQTYEGRAGVDYLFGKGFTTRATAGYMTVDRKEGEGFSGLAADVLVQKTWATGVASLGYRRGLSEDFYSGDNLGVFRYWMLGAAFTYYLQQHLSVMADVSVGNRFYPLVSRNDDFWTLDTGVDYRLRKWLRAGLHYEHYHLETNPQTFGFSNNRYIATISAAY